MTIKKIHAHVAVFDQAVTSGTMFLVGIIFSRAFGVDEYGRFSYAIIICQFVSLLLSTSIIAPMMTIYEKIDNNEREKYIITLFFWTLCLIFLAATAIFILPDKLLWSNVSYLEKWLFSAYMLLNLTGEFFKKINYLRKNITKIIVTSVFMAVGGGAVVFDFFGGGFDGYFLTYIIILTPIFLYIVFHEMSYNINILEIVSCSHRQLSMSSWLTLSGLMSWFGNGFLVLFSAEKLGDAGLGIFRIIQNLFGLILIAIQSMESFFPSMMSKVFVDKGVESAKDVAKKFTKRLLIVGIVVSAGIFLTVNILLTIVYRVNNEGGGASAIALAFVFNIVFVIMAVYPRSIYRVMENNRIIFFANIISTTAAVIFVMSFIDSYGAVALAWGLSLGVILSFLMLNFCLNRTSWGSVK